MGLVCDIDFCALRAILLLRIICFDSTAERF